MNPNPTSPAPQPFIALVGAGYWGRNLARNFQALGVLHTLCDAQPSTLQSYGAGFEAVHKTGDYAAVLADPAVTAVAIAAPAALHHRLAKAALLAGKDVYVEKPLCLEADEGREIAELAARTSRIVMVGHLLQYHPHIQHLAGMVARGDLGRIYYITSNRLNLGKIRKEENALWSFAPHDISVILALAGGQLPQKITCTGESYLTPGVVDTTMTTLKFPCGLRAHVYVTWLNPFKEQKLTVVGSEGMVVFDDTRPWNEKLILHRKYLTWTDGQTPTPNKAAGEFLVVPEAEPLRAECAHFVACCQNRTTPRTDVQEGLRVLQVLQSAQRSLDLDGQPVDSTVPAVAPRPFSAHPTATVDEGSVIGRGTKVWHYSHIMKGARIGERCVFGQNVNVDGNVTIGNNVKVQNNVSIYSGLVIEDDVFLGPSCVLTNVTNPRSQINRHSLYEQTRIRRGATIGANATIVCGVTIGRYAFIGAGAVVTKDVPDYAMILGNPGRQKGWMSRHGHVLGEPDHDGIMVCPESGFRYQLTDAAANHGNGRASLAGTRQLKCLDLDEDAPLPAALATGSRSYDEFKRQPELVFAK